MRYMTKEAESNNEPHCLNAMCEKDLDLSCTGKQPNSRQLTQPYLNFYGTHYLDIWDG